MSEANDALRSAFMGMIVMLLLVGFIECVCLHARTMMTYEKLEAVEAVIVKIEASLNLPSSKDEN